MHNWYTYEYENNEQLARNKAVWGTFNHKVWWQNW